jgi:hypothetical protein
MAKNGAQQSGCTYQRSSADGAHDRGFASLAASLSDTGAGTHWRARDAHKGHASASAVRSRATARSPYLGDDTAASVLEHGSTTADAWVTATREDRTMEASKLDVLGPVDYLVVEFRGGRRNRRRRQARSRPTRGSPRRPRPRNLPVDVASRSASGSPVRPRLRAEFDAIKANALP